jgi:hypothetical protein
MILLNVCQSVPHMKVEVQALRVDFVVASGHKMCGLTGIGFLWGWEGVLNSMTPYQGWWGDDWWGIHDPFLVCMRTVTIWDGYTPHSTGGRRLITLPVSVWKDTQLWGWSGGILTSETWWCGGCERPWTLRGDAPCRTSDYVHSSDLGTFLNVEGVAIRSGHHCFQPLHRALECSHSARVSLYFYNTKEDGGYIDILPLVDDYNWEWLWKWYDWIRQCSMCANSLISLCDTLIYVCNQHFAHPEVYNILRELLLMILDCISTIHRITLFTLLSAGLFTTSPLSCVMHPSPWVWWPVSNRTSMTPRPDCHTHPLWCCYMPQATIVLIKHVQRSNSWTI